MALDEAEMIEILEDIARAGTNQAARISAIKTLRELRRDPDVEEEVGDDIDQLASRRNRQAA